MKNLITFFNILIFFLICGSVEPLFPQSLFQRSVGGPGNEVANSICQTTDGGYIICGTTSSYGAGNNDIYVVKFSDNGIIQWTRTIGGTNSESANSIIRTTDGGYIVSGSTNSYGSGNEDMYVVKLDANGVSQWSKTFGGAAGDNGGSIIQTTDGGYAIAGSTSSYGAGNSDAFVVKLDISGNLQWAKAFGGTLADGVGSIIQTSDGGYIAAGATLSFGGNYNMFVLRIDPNGTLIWSKSIGGSPVYDGVNSIVRSTDGGYVLAGWGQSAAGINDVFIVKLDSTGSFLWSKRIGVTSDDWAYSIVQTADGGYVAAGPTLVGGNNWDFYIIKITGDGTVQWSRTVGGTGMEDAHCIIQTTDGGYLIGGYTHSFGAGNDDIFIVKLDSSGTACGNSTTPPSQSFVGAGATVISPSVQSITPPVTIPTPPTSSGGTVTPVCLVGIEPGSNELPNEFELYQNYPNPFNPTTHFGFQIADFGFVQLLVYDVLGREVETLVNEQLQPGSYEIEWDASDYPSGVYFYTLEANEYKETKKLVLMK